MDELVDRLLAKLQFSDEQAAMTVADLRGDLRVVTISGKLQACEADPDDDKVLECCSVANAEYLVTGDRRHLLPIKTYGNTEIVDARTFLEIAHDAQLQGGATS